MGTNLYRAHSLSGNWVIDTTNTKSLNYFQLELISEM